MKLLVLAWIIACIVWVVWSSGNLERVLRWHKEKKASLLSWLRRRGA